MHKVTLQIKRWYTIQARIYTNITTNNKVTQNLVLGDRHRIDWGSDLIS